MAGLVSDILLRVTGTSEDARRQLREVAAEVAAFNAVDAEATIRANPKDALEKIAEVDAALRLIGTRKVSAEVKVDIDQARARLRILKSELEHALSGGAGARPVEAIAKDIAAVSGEVAQLGTDLASFSTKFGAAMSQVGGSIGSGLTTVLTSLAGGLVTVASTIGLIAIAAAVLVPIIVALTGALLALISSLAAAVAGFAALLTSGIFVAIPAIAVAAFAIIRLVGAVKALQQAEKDRATNAKALKDAEEAHTQAIQAKKDATDNLAKATADAGRAERDAILGVKDAELQLEESRLGIQDAALALEQAKLKLKELNGEAKDPAFGDLLKKATNIDASTPKATVEKLVSQVGALPGGTQHQIDVKQAILDVAHAQLGVKEAAEQSTHATNALSDAQEKNNEFTREGIKAYAPYVEALKQVKTADENLTKTSDAVGDARTKAQAATKKYSDTELSVAQQILKVMATVTKALQPAAAPIGRGISDFLKGLVDLLSDPRIAAGLHDIGDAFGAVFSSLGDLAKSDEVKDTFSELAETAAKLVKSLGTGAFQDLFVIFLRIARTAAPALEDLFNDFNKFTGGIRRSTDDAGKLRKGVNSVVSSFRDWLELGHQLGRVIISLFVGGKSAGDGLVKTITRALRRFADFLNTKKGRQELIDFFNNAIDKVKKIGSDLKTVYNVFSTLVTIVNTLYDALKKTFDLIAHSPIGEAIKGIAGVAGTIAGGGKPSAKSLLEAPVKAAEIPFKVPLSIVKGIFSGFAEGGLVPGSGGRGDDQVHALEGGEFVLRRSVVQAIGVPALSALNNGAPMAAAHAAAGGGDGTHQHFEGDIVLPAAAGGGIGDERDAAVKFGRELRRRGRGR